MTAIRGSVILRKLLAASALVVLLASCAAMRDQVKSPELSVGDVRVTGLSLAEARIAVDLIVRNPNAFGLSADGLTYTMAIQDRTLFEGTTRDKLQVEARRSSTLTLPFSLRYADVLGSLAALKEKRDLRYRLSGKVDFGLFSLPYEKEGSFSLPQLPGLSIEALQVTRAGLGGVELALKLRIDNPNGFPVRFDDVDYDLKLAGVPLLHGRSAQPVAVDGKAAGVATLHMTIGYAQAAAVLEKLRNAPSLPVEFTSRVTLPGAGGRLPYAWSGEVPLTRN